MPLPIDQVYGPAESAGTAEARPLLGSDHRGVLARIGW
jgi:endonuclease/exonuclease/phosphatase (EEP) superfamily protein YafD